MSKRSKITSHAIWAIVSKVRKGSKPQELAKAYGIDARQIEQWYRMTYGGPNGRR